MEPPYVEDDICVLKQETADSLLELSKESPFSMCSADESVASHFALVTAYEDIKKRLREAEKENSFLKRRVKQLEEKNQNCCIQPDELTAGPKYVNKAFSAFRGIYIEKKDLQVELHKMKKEKSESEKHLTEQLQAKELELLQLKTEVETNQVMKKLTPTNDYLELYKVNTELKLHTLQQELDILKTEYSKLRGKYEDQTNNKPVSTQGPGYHSWDASLLQAYRDLKREMSNLYAVTKLQAETVKNLRDNSKSAACRDSSAVPIQSIEDLLHNSRMVNMTAPRPTHKSPCASFNGPMFSHAIAPPISTEAGGLSDDPSKHCWTAERPSPVDSAALKEHPSYGRTSLDENSWSFPSPPKPSDALFWENANALYSSSNPVTCPKNKDREWLRP
ncbi:5-azacytidine-induced protein 2-like isoform X1 [Polyodon spathula]|uniref:5-azacytidine-induced protein 2-like isoform X1 n=1 Tax=Polyodon spathula TaxID=7913 RepID=UPI001B7E73DF|nr:5-azacytidine-induced protein 2-like isoform X1 [Polyodon spathula]XP_041100763.1 5-azacytidine-induced protein 2-like isoform X1 [Polyodon spathula]